MPSLLSVNVGLPKDVPWQGRTVHTGVWKHPVPGPVMARRLNLDGDGQGDTQGHGGEQRAVLVYQIDSYRHWQRHLGRDDFVPGQFGENLTVDGLPDDEVCIGDRYRIGEAEFEVSQPRVTCYRVGLRMGVPEMPALLVAHHRPGFYMRVVQEGLIRAGDPIVRTRTGPGALTVAATDALLYLPGRDPALLRRALAVPALSPGWQGSFRDLLAAEEGGPAADGPAWEGFRTLRVSDVVAETDTVVSLHLTSADGTPLPDARAGQYLTVRVPGSGGPAPIRSYSLSAVPGADGYRISVKHEPHGNASGYLTTALRPGAVLDVAAPRGDFVLEGGTEPVLLVSAGIGVTPVLGMLHELAARSPDRDVWWLHGARGPREHPLAAEAHTVLGSLPHAHEHVFYSAATPEERDRAHAAPGRLTPDAVRALGVPSEASAYVCGPTAFMTDMRQALADAGVDPARVHTELFATLPPITPGLTGTEAPSPHPPAGPPGTGPRVTFARSGVTTPFPDGARSLLDLADACDVPARWSCRTGVCHTCVTPVLSGEVGYAPAPLEPPPAGQALICCSRPRTDVVLDM
ncbi:MOSC domain-containing protein [Streptomyces sp. NPDC052302]|uniref:MOSC domain-containing protein n=1 Tax=unclassified Streptomyces TaxID=2593676 RepID=UPI0037D856D5